MKTSTPRLPTGCQHFRSQGEMPAELCDRLRQIALEHGDTYSSYLITEPDREYFWSATGRGVVGFGRRGRFVTVADGLLAAEEDREALLLDFLAFAQLNRLHTSYLNVPRSQINLFRKLGCEVTKCGEEPLVQLQPVRWQGKTWEWPRRQESYCLRQGVVIREAFADEDDYRAALAPQIDAISREHVAHTLHRREMQFFVSQFTASDLRDRRLFVAEHAGAVVAFIVCNPGLAGNFWAVEVYRRRGDAPRGVIPATIMHAMRQMQAEGVEYFSLSLAPFLRCTPVVGDSAVFRTVANFWWRRLNAVFDVQGLFHFKSRFRPHYREMYLAAYPHITVRSMWSMAMSWKLFHLNPLRLVGRWRRMAGAAEDRGLAEPDRTADRMIRRLHAKRLAVTASAAALPPVASVEPHEQVPA